MDLATPSTILAVSLVAATHYTLVLRQQPNITRMISKTASTALLATYVSVQATAPSLLSYALALGSLGDAFLAWDGDGFFLCGLTSFLAAHILYITVLLDQPFSSLLSYAGLQSIPFTRLETETWRVVLAVVMLGLGAVMGTMLIPSVGRELRAPVLVYSIAILAMVVSALTVEDVRVVWGAVLFAASDSILASEKFLVGGGSAWSGPMQYAVWVLYYSGQLLIAIGLLG